MLRVRVGFTVTDAEHRVPTIEFFHSFRGFSEGGWNASETKADSAPAGAVNSPIGSGSKRVPRSNRRHEFVVSPDFSPTG